MQIRITAGLLGVALAIGGPPFATLSLRAHELPLRKGMTEKEVEAALNNPTGFRDMACIPLVCNAIYYPDPDWFGNREEIHVLYLSKRVAKWETKPLPRVRPPWLDKALKSVGY